MKSEVYKEKQTQETNWSLAFWIVLPSYAWSKNANTTSEELHLLLPKESKSALKSMVGFLNTYFETLQFIEVIYITNKYNE
jgi:hypothetical protein